MTNDSHRLSGLIRGELNEIRRKSITEAANLRDGSAFADVLYNVFSKGFDNKRAWLRLYWHLSNPNKTITIADLKRFNSETNAAVIRHLALFGILLGAPDLPTVAQANIQLQGRVDGMFQRDRAVMVGIMNAEMITPSNPTPNINIGVQLRAISNKMRDVRQAARTALPLVAGMSLQDVINVEGIDTIKTKTVATLGIDPALLEAVAVELDTLVVIIRATVPDRPSGN